jgi:hypothetical protein
MVKCHYEVNLEAVASGYVVSEGVEDEVAMERADALAAAAAETLAEDFEDFLFPDAPDGQRAQSLRPLGAGPFFGLSVRIWAV